MVIDFMKAAWGFINSFFFFMKNATGFSVCCLCFVVKCLWSKEGFMECLDCTSLQITQKEAADRFLPQTKIQTSNNLHSIFDLVPVLISLVAVPLLNHFPFALTNV